MAKEKSNAVAIKGTFNISNPSQMAAMANVLKGHVVKNKLYTTISGKNYAHVEGWQFAGGLMGLFPIIKKVEDLSKAEEKKWLSECEIENISTSKIVGRGYAICSNKENRKKSFDEYAIMSMAQTRAIGKAYRNLIGWVMKLAGYEGTPSEEMTKVGETPSEPIPPGAKSGPDGDVVYLCQDCDRAITPQEAEFSKKIFKKRLCRDCQKNNKKK